MTTMKQLIESDLEFTDTVNGEANILFMKPSMVHKLIEDSKVTQGTRYLEIKKSQVLFVGCPIIEIAENYTDNYVFLHTEMVETALQFYKNERFDPFRYQLWDSLETEGKKTLEPPTGNEEPVFDVEIAEHLVSCYQRWKDNVAILEYKESLKAQ